MRRMKFGQIDASMFARYVASEGASVVQAEGSRARPSDLVAASLMSARGYWRNCFGSRRADGARFRVYPGLVADRRPNAFAWIEQDLHVCGLNVGLAAAVLELSLFCLAQADVLTAFGRPERESSPAPADAAPGFRMPAHLAVLDGRLLFDELPAYFPEDPTRQAVAHYLALLILRFVWFHELYHGLNGHVGYVQRQRLALRLNETAGDDEVEDSDVLKALEFDADQSAFYVCCKIQGNDTENMIGARQLTPAQRLHLTLFGAYAVTWLFDEHARQRAARTGGTHPSPYLRMHNLLRCAATYLADDLPDLGALNHAVLADFDRLADRLPQAIGSDRFLSDMQSPGFQADLDRFDGLMIRLRVEIDPFAYR